MNANPLRRIMAIVYDMLLLTALLFAATAIALALNGGKAIDTSHDYYWLYLLYLAAISFTYYHWFWSRGGQTPGMKTWRMQLYRSSPVDLKFSLLYVVAAIVSWLLAGTGFLLAFLHPQRKTLHDILLGSEIRDIRKM